MSTILLLQSCSNLLIGDRAETSGHDQKPTLPKDYIDQYENLSLLFKAQFKSKLLKIDEGTKKYLNGIAAKIFKYNEIFLGQSSDLEFVILDDDLPFFFSLPSGTIFFSSSLLKKYIKSERVFQAIIALEIYKISHGTFIRKTVVPLGYTSLNQLIAISRLPVDFKVEIDKWAFYLLKRSGMDPTAVLSLIQIINKHALEFSFHNGEYASLSREEYLFKSFIVKESLSMEIAEDSKNSSGGFYNLIRGL
ncbi:MAG: hypothetical protein A2X86_04775 [Bdellovibrionales bacterium GWA2_49_15]|nr:MAG: hypothetical protein A2X86_04775 [Bdellovibrionales bacterium GWA2_49_15]